jgi:hypothetical protein
MSMEFLCLVFFNSHFIVSVLNYAHLEGGNGGGAKRVDTSIDTDFDGIITNTDMTTLGGDRDEGQ